MARVKICPSCGSENLSNVPFCDCGSGLADVEITESVPVTSSATAPTGSPNPSESAEHRGASPESELLQSCEKRPVLTFPWGDVEVGETLFVGRDQNVSQFGDYLEQEGYGWVSRRHAELYVEDGVLYVRDVGSTHGTFVNGQKIEGQPVALADGDQLTFSRQLAATVRLS